MSRWNTFLDAVGVVRCRRLLANGRVHDALTLLEAGPRRGSTYDRLIRLYRLELMVSAGDSRRFNLAAELEKEEWRVGSEDDRYFDIYRRYMTAAIRRDWQTTREAGRDLQHLRVRPFIRNTIPPPSQQFLQELD